MPVHASPPVLPPRRALSLSCGGCDGREGRAAAEPRILPLLACRDAARPKQAQVVGVFARAADADVRAIPYLCSALYCFNLTTGFARIQAPVHAVEAAALGPSSTIPIAGLVSDGVVWAGR